MAFHDVEDDQVPGARGKHLADIGVIVLEHEPSVFEDLRDFGKSPVHEFDPVTAFRLQCPDLLG